MVTTHVVHTQAQLKFVPVATLFPMSLFGELGLLIGWVFYWIPLGTDMGKLHLKYILDGLEKAATVSASKSYTTVFQTVFWEVLVYL